MTSNLETLTEINLDDLVSSFGWQHSPLLSRLLRIFFRKPAQTFAQHVVEYDDTVTGSIKWVEDPNRASNGKGQYEFNLRWNEDKVKPASTEADAFKGANDEEAFFAVDNSVPSLTGKVDYVDTMAKVNGEDSVTASKITYQLDANQLTKQQVMNFIKLWLLGIGPTNDE